MPNKLCCTYLAAVAQQSSVLQMSMLSVTCYYQVVLHLLICVNVGSLRFLKLFEKYDVKKKLKIKLKSPGELQVWYIYTMWQLQVVSTV